MRSSRDELKLMLEQWKSIVSEEKIDFDDVLNMMLQEKSLDEAFGLNKGLRKAGEIGTILALLFTMSASVSFANPSPDRLDKFAATLQGQTCDGHTCSLAISNTVKTQIQSALNNLGISLEFSDIEGLSEDNAVKVIKEEIIKNKDKIFDALKGENAKAMSGIEENTDLKNKSNDEIIRIYKSCPNADLYKELLKMLQS